MDAEHLNCYRINYDAKFWTSRSEHLQETLCAPIGAVLAVNALCDEVERLTQQSDKLASDVHRCYRMLLSDPDTKGALFKAENILREALAEVNPAA